MRLADGGWHRVHPLTPAIKSWQLVVVVLLFAAQNTGPDLARGDLPNLDRPHLGGRALAGGGVAVAVFLLVVVALAYLSWRMTRFRVTEDALELHSGVLFRQQRRARLDRLQAVDVVQPFLARLAGLAQLKMEVAGGTGSGVTLSYLTEAQASSLRAHLLARAAGVRYDTHEAPEAPEHPVLELPTPRLVASLALSGLAVGSTIGVLALIAIAVVVGNVGPAIGVLPTLAGMASLLWARFNRGFGFRLATSPDGVRLRHGLLEQRAQTVPPGRVQALRLSQPLLWRRPDWWTIDVNVAGYGGSEGGGWSTESVLLPVGTRDDAIAVLALVIPDLGVEDGESPRRVVDAGLSATGPEHAYLLAPPRARWVDPVGWRRIGARVTRESLLIRQGRLVRRLVVVPHARSQSWALTQGPLQRRLRVASFVLHSTRGPVTPQVPHLDAAEALRLLTEQADRARHARATAGPERWMEAGGRQALHGGEPRGQAPGGGDGAPGAGEPSGQAGGQAAGGQAAGGQAGGQAAGGQ